MNVEYVLSLIVYMIPINIVNITNHGLICYIVVSKSSARVLGARC